jgi:hypothetical protein
MREQASMTATQLPTPPQPTVHDGGFAHASHAPLAEEGIASGELLAHDVFWYSESDGTWSREDGGGVMPEATARLISLARLARHWARRASLKKRMNNGLSYSVYAPTLDSTNRHRSPIPFESFRFDTTRYLRTFSSDLRRSET